MASPQSFPPPSVVASHPIMRSGPWPPTMLGERSQGAKHTPHSGLLAEATKKFEPTSGHVQKQPRHPSSSGGQSSQRAAIPKDPCLSSLSYLPYSFSLSTHSLTHSRGQTHSTHLPPTLTRHGWREHSLTDSLTSHSHTLTHLPLSHGHSH